jgi:NitT/TauT family transport system substrate-binding protein/sulfonate transport system substrate-binding protein
MAAGSLDIGGVMNTTSVILARSGGNNVQIVSGFSRPANMFSIVVKDPSITRIQDLAGKKVAGPKGTVLHQLLSAALASEGMDMQQVEFLQMGLPQSSTALLAGHIDAALLAGSLVIKAQKSGARVLTTAKGLVSPKLVIAARGGFADSYPELVELYAQVHAESVAWMESHLKDAILIGAEEQGISPDEARQLYDWTEFTTTLTNEDIRTMREDIAFMQAHDLLQNKIEPESFIAESAIN